MSGNNLKVVNTGLDHCYLNGIPIVEAEIEISDLYKKIARITSLAVNADPYFNSHTNAQKLFSESHGEGDRITKDFLEDGARDILPLFSPFQRLIPEGSFDTTPLVYEFTDQLSDFSWSNPDATSIFINSIKLKSTSGSGDIEIIVDGSSLSTASLPETESYTYNQNVRNNNIAELIAFIVSNESADFVFDVEINAVKYDSVGWIKALTEIGDVKLSSYRDDIKVNYLIEDFTWSNSNLVKVNGVVIKHNCGSAYVTISYNGIAGTERFLEKNTIGDDYFDITEDITEVSISLRDATDDFNYDLIINTELPRLIPSPRFEFDSNWNPGKIIFRYQNMDTRVNKLDYTLNTLKNTRVDPNIFDNVLNFLNDALKNYVLKELYLAIGYDKKAVYYNAAYEMSRRDVKYWVRSEKGLQTQLHYGV